eukprot:237990-Karenia_brevis.AAC.1
MLTRVNSSELCSSKCCCQIRTSDTQNRQANCRCNGSTALLMGGLPVGWGVVTLNAQHTNVEGMVYGPLPMPVQKVGAGEMFAA